MGLMDADGFITFVDVGNLLTSSHTLGGGIPPINLYNGFLVGGIPIPL